MPRLLRDGLRACFFPPPGGQPRDQNGGTQQKPMAVQRLGHVALRGGGQCRATGSIRPLGFQVHLGTDDWTYLQSPKAAMASACSPNLHSQPDPFRPFHFSDRAEVELDSRSAAGSPATASAAVHDHRDGTASFYLQDPEGNWLEMLYEPPTGIVSTNTCLQPDATKPGWVWRFRGGLKRNRGRNPGLLEWPRLAELWPVRPARLPVAALRALPAGRGLAPASGAC